MSHRASRKKDWPALSLLQSQLDFDLLPPDPSPENAVHVAPVLMMPSRDIVLFQTQPPRGQGPASFFGSILVHALAALVVWFSLLYKPPLARVTEDHLMVRQLDLRSPAEQRADEDARMFYPNLHPGKAATGGRARQSPPLPRPLTHASPGPQTLIQADLLNPITLPQHIPVPQVVIWSPSKTTAKHVVPPLPEKPTSADVVPVPERPNQELNLADVNIASSIQPSPTSRFVASTTSPVTVHVPNTVQLPPASAAQQTATPTPAAILSLSDLRLKDGTAALPPVNESPAAKAQGALAPGQSQNSSAQAGKGAPSARPGAPGSSQNPAAAANRSGSSPATAAKLETVSPALGSGAATDASDRFSSTPISLPKDGHFGAVIVGDDLDQEYPEMIGLWGGRMAYTAYLHVGLSKSWILQYSLPLNTDASAGGVVSPLEAPWPYNIVRPNLAPGAIDSDALMVRGFVDESGRFQNLSIVFPQAFSGAQFVLSALQQWQFRPAMQNGQPARVEVLLIIPEVLE